MARREHVGSQILLGISRPVERDEETSKVIVIERDVIIFDEGAADDNATLGNVIAADLIAPRSAIKAHSPPPEKRIHKYWRLLHRGDMPENGAKQPPLSAEVRR